VRCEVSATTVAAELVVREETPDSAVVVDGDSLQYRETLWLLSKSPRGG
jgi:hypothetical protein